MKIYVEISAIEAIAKVKTCCTPFRTLDTLAKVHKLFQEPTPVAITKLTLIITNLRHIWRIGRVTVKKR